MQWPPLPRAFPLRIALLMSAVPAVTLIIFLAWFGWGLQPLERYYLMAYWGSSTSAKQPGSTTRIEWLFKAAPGRKSEPVTDVDVATGGMWNLSLELSSSANERGWISLAKSRPEAVNSAELEGLLQEAFYGNRNFRQVIAEPLLYASGVPFLVLYVAFMMKRVLGIEWNRLREEVSASELAFNLAETWRQFAMRIRSWIGRRLVVEKAPLQRDYSVIKAIPHSASIPDKVRQADASPLMSEKQYLPSSLKEPPQRRSIFPGRAASVHNTKERSKPWNESQWID
jgi:hypothetical protein